ncbi:hypothetical protein [Methylobacter sp.]|uniref:hypothetical protein n=1 Tax=Methylobacter sp. TaxID=2051955 RepID=UPI002489E75B|nr:hypothetical protein [Methylobacter sp.]MDI1275985.1 hypothetical protein [Methylobacter sp.]MDI1356727.1 hypothetical protein [Methylobacter sp.]
MLKQRFLLLLILMMAITPVWSALGYYSGMASSLSAEPSFEQAVAVADAALQSSEHCLHPDKFKIDCHANGSCTFHVCGDGGIAAVFVFIQAYSSYRYEHWEQSVSRSLAFSPEIRPPINSL